MADPPEGGFLPPQPPGPDPELGSAPKREPTPPQPPPAQWGQAPPAGAQPPPGWQHPPPPGWQQPQWVQPVEPDNTPAITGFVLAMVSAALWLLSAGLSTLLSLGLAIGGVFVSRTGKRRVADGVTSRNKGLAQAGFVCSIVMIVLSTLSTLAWTAFFVLLIVDEDFRNDFDDSNDGGDPDFDGITTTVRLGVLGVRVLAHLLS